jgi:DNA repair protein RecO (recombination protein O)
VRLATLELGVQSVIAKGALRPKSRFGASLQVLSEGSAILHYRDRRELQTLTAFDSATVRVALAENLAAFAAASVLAEMMLRFSPSERHPESYHLVRQGLALLEAAPPDAVDVIGLRLLWQLVCVLGFAPEMTVCVRDGADLPEGAVAFSPAEGGVLCRSCAGTAARQLPNEARADLLALLDASAPLPLLDERHAAAHRRLLARYVEHHLAEGAELPAMAFWLGRIWDAA